MSVVKRNPDKAAHADSGGRGGGRGGAVVGGNGVKRPRGHQTCYTAEAAEIILSLLAAGKPLNEICRDDPTLPAPSTISLWSIDDREGFAARYARARQAQAMRWAEELNEIADNGSNDWMLRNDPNNPGYELNGEHIQRSRLRTDTRKWLLAKVLPKIYGDKVVQEITGANGGPIQISAVDRPPNESRDDWVARRAREISGHAALLGTPAGSAD